MSRRKRVERVIERRSVSDTERDLRDAAAIHERKNERERKGMKVRIETRRRWARNESKKREGEK